MQLRSFFSILSQLRLLRLPFLTIKILFVGCNKESEKLFFFSKKRTELEVRYTLLHVCSITGASLQFCFSFFFFTSLMKESMITVRLQYYINSARALFLAAEVTCNACFFFTLFPAHTFSS